MTHFELALANLSTPIIIGVFQFCQFVLLNVQNGYDFVLSFLFEHRESQQGACLTLLCLVFGIHQVPVRGEPELLLEVIVHFEGQIYSGTSPHLMGNSDLFELFFYCRWLVGNVL